MRLDIISSKELKTEFTHPEDLTVPDKTEHENLALFSNTASTDSPDKEAHKILMGRLKRGVLSIQALPGLANACYRYWYRQLPSAESIAAAEQTIQQCKKQWETIAHGQALYRSMENQRTVYYLANPKAERPNQSGVFYECYPNFTLSSEPATGKIESVSDLKLSATETADLIRQEQAEDVMQRWRQGCLDLHLLTEVLQQKLPLRERLISDYRVAQIFYHGDHLDFILPKENSHQSVLIYFSRLVGREALSLWHQKPSAVSADFNRAVQALREAIENRLLLHKHLLMHGHEFWQNTEDLAAFKSISHFQLKLSTDEKDDPYRMGVRNALKRACQSSPPTVLVLTEKILANIRLWLMNHHTALAQAQLSFYLNALQKEADLLLQRGRPLFESLQRSITDCEALKGLLKKPEEIAFDPHRGIPSQWQARDEILQQWRIAIKDLWNNPTKISQCNVEYAQRLMAHLCEEIQRQLGEPPCAYVVFAMGSFSRGEVGPTSDIDFGFLIAAKHSFYFKAFLDGMAYKASSFPEGILPLESKELYSIRGGECWIATPTEMIEKYCFLPDSEQSRFSDSARSLPVRWAKPLYIPSNGPASQELWAKYQSLLKKFYNQSNAIGIPYYRLTEPYCLKHHLQKDGILEAGQAMAHTTHEEKNPPTPIANTVDLKAMIYPLTNAAQCYARSAGILEPTEAQTLLEQLQALPVFPPIFIQQLRSALFDLTHWRMRLQWAHLNGKSPTDLHGNNVYLWPTTPADQQKLIKFAEEIPELRGFYLDAKEVERLNIIQLTIKEVIERSLPDYVQQFTTQIDYKDTADKKQEINEDKTSALKFNPLQAAIDWTEHQLLQEIQKNEASVITIDQHLAWLAAIRAINPHSDTLLVSLQQMLADWLHNTRSNQRPFFQVLAYTTATRFIPMPSTLIVWTHEHLAIYRKIPREYRGLYVDLLQEQLQRLHPTYSQELINRLSIEPDSEGWRLTMMKQQERWQADLTALFETKAEEKADLHFISQVPGYPPTKTIRSYPCPASIREQLSREKPDNQPGRHRVVPIHIKKHQFAGKIDPEQPGTEHLVAELAWRVSGEEILPNWLINAQDSSGHSEAIQLFPYLPGTDTANLEKILLEHPEYLNQLEPTCFTRLLLRVLLINPEDDKGDDYILVPAMDAQGKPSLDAQGNPYYKLIRIDNERAFFPIEETQQGGFFSAKVQKTLLVKSILLCFNDMEKPLHSQVIDEFLQLNPVTLLEAWLKEVENRQPIWSQLFNDTAIKELATRKESKTGKAMPSFPIFILPAGIERELLTRLTLMQDQLRAHRQRQTDQKTTELTGIDLLKVVQPALAQHYSAAFIETSDKPQKPELALKRFTLVVGDNKKENLAYKRNALGYRESSHDIVMAMTKSLQLSVRFSPDDLKQIREAKQHSYAQALRSLLSLKNQPISVTKNSLLHQNPTSVAAFQQLSVRQQMTLVNEFETKLEQSDGNIFTPQQQLFLLRAYQTVPFCELKLSGFKKVLTYKALEPLLAGAGNYLTHLDLSNCALLEESVLSLIEENCPNLRTLILRGLTKFKKIGHSGRWSAGLFANEPLPLKLPHLTKLDATHCPLLTDLYIEAPIGCHLMLSGYEIKTISTTTRGNLKENVKPLLRLAGEGEQELAENLIIQNRQLLLIAGEFTDLSGRTFSNITAFQYALWARDWRMWTMIQKYLPAKSQREQFNLLESKGTEHKSHYDIKPLTDALQTYIEKCNDEWNLKKLTDNKLIDPNEQKERLNKRKEYWCKEIGGEQKLLPAHIVNEYCHPTRSFVPCPDFKEPSLPRSRQLDEGEWFTAKYLGGPLGLTFAIYRHDCGKARRGVAIETKNFCDLTVLQTLWEVRTQQFEMLKSELFPELNPSQRSLSL